MYCHVCAAYGHSPRLCPDKVAWAVRKGLPSADIQNLTLSVRDTEDGVKGVLKRYNVTPGTTRLENRKLLNDLANSLEPPRMVVFINK